VVRLLNPNKTRKLVQEESRFMHDMPEKCPNLHPALPELPNSPIMRRGTPKRNQKTTDVLTYFARGICHMCDAAQRLRGVRSPEPHHAPALARRLLSGQVRAEHRPPTRVARVHVLPQHVVVQLPGRLPQVGRVAPHDAFLIAAERRAHGRMVTGDGARTHVGTGRVRSGVNRRATSHVL
jgi:hypothetical protein